MKRTILSGFGFLVFSAVAAVDRPSVLTFDGSGYHADGWYSYSLSVHSDGHGLLFDDQNKFLLSPRYAAPIRKIVVNVSATAIRPARYFRLRPHVQGRECPVSVYDCAITNVQKEKSFECRSFDFSPNAGVDAFRIGLDGSGTGNWQLANVYVFYGEKDADEDGLLKQLGQELPPPANLRIADFTADSLQAIADPVADAAGYRYRIEALDGIPETEEVECFAQGTNLSVVGWTLQSENAKLSVYDGGTVPDSREEGERRALKIECASTKQNGVSVDVVTSWAPERIKEVSFVAKAGSNGKSDRISVCGRIEPDGAWQPLGEVIALTNSSKRIISLPVADDVDVRQIRFRFEAASASVTVCGLDSLRIAYGGNETRRVVAEGEGVEPSCARSGLESGRYAVSLQAIAGAPYHDSSWSVSTEIDLKWAALAVTPPTGVRLSAAGGKLTIEWDPVDDADHYLVTVVPVDDPSAAVVTNLKTRATAVTVAVPSVGEYSAVVTAVSPGGKSMAASTEVCGEVQLDQLGDVRAQAVDRDAITATWKTIPLAENYQAKLIRIGGATEVFEYGWQTEEDAIVLPDGWTCQGEWDHDRWTADGISYPLLPYSGCSIESTARERPLTKIVCRYKCGSSREDVQSSTVFCVDVAGSSGEWRTAAEVAPTSRLAELSLSFAAHEDVRRVRLRCCGTSLKTVPSVAVGKLFLTYGEETRIEVASAGTTKGEVTFRDLDPTGRYLVVVAPQPSEGSTSASTTIDLAAERFRMTGAVPLSSLRHGLYEQTFDCLTNVLSDTEVRKSGLDYWQLFKGSGEVEKLLYTSGTNRTTGGVYAFGGNGGSPSLGTLATSTMGCRIGLAFRNDGDVAVALSSLSFETLQRSAREHTSSYRLEWLLTDGECGLDAEGDWQTVAIPDSAPYAGTLPGGETEYRQALTILSGLPQEKIPPGGVLIFRWSHDKVSSGPMMAIDDVKVEFSNQRRGLLLIVK